MTIAEAKNKLVAWCLGEVGYHEGTNNWNKYAEKWTQAGGWNAQNQPWCDISWIALLSSALALTLHPS